MGTRSVVAARQEDGSWRGRYVHWDGYPDGVGAAVQEIVKRDGRDQAIETLLVQNFGWSSVDAQREQELGSGYTDGRFRAVPGYGVAYTTEQNQSHSEDWYDAESVRNEGGYIEYVHIIELDGSVTSLAHDEVTVNA